MHRRRAGHGLDPVDQALGDMPFLARHQQQRPRRAKAGLGLPEPGGKPAADPSARGQKGELRRAVVADREVPPGFGIKRAQPLFQRQRVRADLAREQKILRQQKVVMIVVKGHRHAIVGE